MIEFLNRCNFSSKKNSILRHSLSCVVDVVGFGVDGADGVDVPDVDAVAEVHGVWAPSFMPLPPLRP